MVLPQPRRAAGAMMGILRYLQALTFDFHAGGEVRSCVLIYAQPDPEHPGIYHPRAAAETGYEGIACLDDTARAALLALKTYEQTGNTQALGLARRWLSFVEYMQYPDGSFANFILNAAGRRNASGPTSVRGGYWWSCRALWALAAAYRITGEETYLDRYRQCVLADIPDGKISAVRCLAEIELYRHGPSLSRRNRILDHCALMAAMSEPYLRDHPDTETVNLWGYHQLHALAEASLVLEEPSLLEPCRRTVRTLIEPDVRARFWYSYPDRRKDGVCAYTVAPIVQGLAAMHRAGGAARYRELALRAAAWFYGRNDARVAMYDPTTGRCRDGIAGGRASMNYGAESSIEAGFAEIERQALIGSA